MRGREELAQAERLGRRVAVPGVNCHSSLRLNPSLRAGARNASFSRAMNPASEMMKLFHYKLLGVVT